MFVSPFTTQLKRGRERERERERERQRERERERSINEVLDGYCRWAKNVSIQRRKDGMGGTAALPNQPIRLVFKPSLDHRKGREDNILVRLKRYSLQVPANGSALDRFSVAFF